MRTDKPKPLNNEKDPGLHFICPHGSGCKLFPGHQFSREAGVGFANLTGDANGDPLFSYKVGGGMNIGLGGHWELHPDLFFVRKG